MAASETLQTPITGEEFFHMSDTHWCELVQGRIVQMSPAGGRHGELALAIGSLLRTCVKSQRIGKVYAAETGIYIQRNPDTVRAPDAMFVSNERLARITDPAKFLDVAPDLAVEVLSLTDTWTEIETKIAEYLAIGVRLVWLIDPDPQTITIYRPSGERTRLSRSDALSGEDVLPDFSVPIAEIFE